MGALEEFVRVVTEHLLTRCWLLTKGAEVNCMNNYDKFTTRNLGRRVTVFFLRYTTIDQYIEGNVNWNIMVSATYYYFIA